jgi:uncharacterized membrane protein HdeD (DUF308 family)
VSTPPAGSRAEPPAVPFWQVTVLGIATLLFGIAVLTWPAATLRTLGALVGVWLMVAGISRILSAFFSKQGVGRQVLSVTVGVILLGGGVACVRNIARSVFVLALMIALAWILSGLTELLIAFRTSGATKGWLIALAVVSIVIGVVFLLWSDLSLTAIVVMTGISAVVIGISEIAFAFQLRQAAAARA